MMKYYYDLMSQPSRACYIFLKKNKIPFTPCPLRITKGEHRSEEYTKINPFQLVPAIEHNGFNLTESVAILRYLCREFPHVGEEWYPSDSKIQARIDEYMEWQHLNTRMQLAMYFQTKFIIPKMTGTEPDMKTVERSQDRMETILDQFEEIWLDNRPYVAGDKITVADIVAICELEQPSMAGYDVTEGRPKLAEYMKRVKKHLQPEYDEAFEQVYRVRGRFWGGENAPHSKL
ncbi:unnamed protein product [Meganyctiphanes norvegica]|uniref:glutathione transferase n=1 Tax=Meganyctiphanes norvegica TaxID=48144 RepID=A0AAV2QF61_MEGNR